MKCIIFSRVSTETQTLEQQTQLLIEEAKRAGYAEEECEIIEEKESAIKLDEEERRGLNRLKKAIEGDKDIECVICYEVSRLSRRQKILFSVRDYLIEHKIMLIVVKPYIRVLEKGGVLSETGSMMFSFIASFSELEMSTKKARMQRGKKFKMKQGFYGGGGLSYGYCVADDGKITINEKQAEIIHKIYNMYLSGYSCMTIGKRLFELGEIDSPNMNAATQMVTKVLSNEQYVGKVSKTNYTYPQIVTQDEYNEAKKIRGDKRRIKTDVSMIYFCQGLLFNDDYRMTPSKNNRRYVSYKKEAGNVVTINMDLVDSIAWQMTKQKIELNKPSAETRRIELQKTIKELNGKMTSIDRQISKLEQAIDRAERLIIAGTINEQRGALRIQEINDQITDLNIQQDRLRYDIAKHENDLIYCISFMFKEEEEQKIDELYDDFKKRDMIRNTIKRIDVDKQHNKKGRFNITLIYCDGAKENYSLISTAWSKHLFDENEREINIDYIKRVCVY